MNPATSARADAVQPGPEPEASERLTEMEQAAQASSDPQHIKAGRSVRREPASHADKVWLAGLAVALLLMLATHWFLDWRPELLPERYLAHIHNHLRGAALIAGILLVARLLEVLVLSRVVNAVNRFNLRRVL